MKRRSFLQRGSLLGSFAAFPLASACTTPQTPDSSTISTFERPFPELEEITVTALQKAMETGRWSAEAVVKMYLDRIEKMDKAGPSVNSVIEVNPDALNIAQALDQERKEGKIRGPLHGIPILIKDNIDTGDKMLTTAGSLALASQPASKDAFIVQKLREAGAVLLGKTNLSEWANFRSTRSSSGWSGRGGQTRNPYALNRNPCGSSSGSGAAVSASFCAIAIGTETNGSIVCPSSTNGVVGIKPTVGLWSRSGIIPISHSQDTAGPMARTVADAALLLGTLAHSDPEDAITAQSSGKASQDYTQFLDASSLKGARIGIGKQYFGFHEKVDPLMETALDTMREKGAELIEIEQVVPRGKTGNAGFQILLYEFKAGLNNYFANREGSPISDLESLIVFNQENAQEEMPYFLQELLEMAQEKGGLEEQEYLDALKTIDQYTRKEGLDKIMEEHQLDAIVAPTGGPAWPIDLITGDHFLGGSSSPAARAGYPNITVPAGFVSGLPIGLSLFGKAWSESKLIALAYAFEQATHHRQHPQFLPQAVNF